MTQPKTAPTSASVEEFLAGIADPRRLGDAQAICAIMREVTGVDPVMWGPSIVGFGTYHLVYASGRKGEWPAVGFSPRKQNLVLYISEGFDTYADLLARLGRHTTGRSCLYLRRLSDVDETTLRAIIQEGFSQLNGATVRG